MEYKKIDDIKKYVNSLLENGKQISLYIKKATISVRKANIGEEVITYIKDKETGKLIEETRQIIKDENIYVVTNVGGEVYAITLDTLNKNYYKGEKENEYIAKATPRKVIEIDENISFVAPWGEIMNLQAGAWLNVDDMTKIYGINPIEFYQTYKKYEQ